MFNLCRSACLCVLLACAALPAISQWIVPTPEELSMTSIPQVPGATAVYLNLDQRTDDRLRMFSFYVRLKVLTEGGKDYANVELPYVSNVAGRTVDDIVGRTIQPDGSVVLFTGKPYEKLIARNGSSRYKAKVFTLPAVQVGSILEYRFKIHYDDGYFINPNWFIQSELYLKKGHYQWIPTGSSVIDNDDGGNVSNTVAWTPILPPGAAVKEGLVGGVDTISLDISDVPPVAKEVMMPPTDSLGYRVLFYYTGYRTADQYWKSVGNRWSNKQNHFIGPDSRVRDAVAALRVASETPDQTLRRIYAQVMTFENTDFTRQQTAVEDKAHGLKTETSSGDVLERKRGTGDELTDLFVGMARAAGFKANVMYVANRNRRFFLPTYLSMSQLDDLIAIVDVDGKEVFFDPGQRYCGYGRLAWYHQYAGGIRQADKGIAVAMTAGEPFNDNHSSRVADLTLDDRGVADGTVVLTYEGGEALHWRHVWLHGDMSSVKHDLKANLEKELPGGMDVQVIDVKDLENPDKPLKISYHVQGAIGTPAGKRLLVPVDPFEAGKSALFPQAKRETSIDLHFASYVQDAVRYQLPPDLTAESVPEADKELYEHQAGFTTSSVRSGNNITFYRNVSMAKVLVMPAEYPDFRKFYNKLESQSQGSMVLTHGVATASVTATK